MSYLHAWPKSAYLDPGQSKDSACINSSSTFFEAEPDCMLFFFTPGSWQWWAKLQRKSGDPASRLAVDGSFTWAERGKEEVEKELFEEGVAVLGSVSEDWMCALEDFCATVPYETVLSLGCNRREDSYASKVTLYITFSQLYISPQSSFVLNGFARACLFYFLPKNECVCMPTCFFLPTLFQGLPLAAPWAEWMKGCKHEYGYSSVISAFPVDEDEPDQVCVCVYVCVCVCVFLCVCEKKV